MTAHDLPQGATSAPGAYVHVPFCAHRCTYCSFVALEGRREEEDFFEAVEREVRSRAAEAAGGFGGFDSVYFGGGTPSYVEAARLGPLLGTLKEIFGFSSNVEITAEANPDDLGSEKLSDLLALGINRLSIGVQSLVDAELVPLERRHDAASARRSVSEASRSFGNVSADLMIGIPGQTKETLLASVEGLLSCGITHLSVYLLELEKAPRLVALRKERPELFPDDDEMADRWEAVDERLTAAGLPRYEMSNWAKPGFESRHNLKYWTLTPVLGFGVSAHSFDGKTRFANTGMMAEYLRRIREGVSPVATSEENQEDLLRKKEGLMLGLRLSGGVPFSTFEEIRKSLSPDSASRMDDVFLAGLLERAGERVHLTRRGVLLSNEVFSLLV
ncbi:MAG TPA: radical SAM family heme chaperone HemW [Thermoanaerobaculia bacterium]|nr:radical SAM family heme chaperone HemW [Thermoanaerobaculia bacterium]